MYQGNSSFHQQISNRYANALDRIQTYIRNSQKEYYSIASLQQQEIEPDTSILKNQIQKLQDKLKKYKKQFPEFSKAFVSTIFAQTEDDGDQVEEELEQNFEQYRFDPVSQIMSNNLKEAQDQILQLRKEIATKNSEIFEHITRNAKKDKIIRNYQSKLQKNKLKIEKLSSTAKSLKFQLQQIKRIIRQNLQQNKIFITDKISHIFKKTIESQQVFKDMEVGLQIQKKQNEQRKQDNRRMQRQILDFCKKSSQYTGIIIKQDKQVGQYFPIFAQQLFSYFKCVNLFSDSKIITEQFQKQWLHTKFNSIISHQSKFASKLIYKNDPYNKTNFHSYIDHIYDIFIVIKLENGFKVGGYSHHPFDKTNMEKGKRGFLFNLNNKVIFKPKQNSSIIGYDDYYIVFGSSQLRIKTQQMKLFSNFGVSTGCFNTEGVSCINFTGSMEKEVPIESYEIYQIIY